MKKNYFLLTLILTAFIWQGNAQSITQSLTPGIDTDRGFTSLPLTSSCPGILSFIIPAGNAIDSVSTSYDISAVGGGWMSEQRSWLYSPTVSAGESTIFNGSGNSTGTVTYNRTGISFANAASGTVDFALHAGRTYGGSGCNSTYNRVDAGTWSVTVYYSAIVAPSITQSLTLGIDTDRGFTSLSSTSSCPGILSFTIPTGNIIDSVSTSYDISAVGGGWMSEQRSWLYSPTVSAGESTIFNGSGNSTGTVTYNRTGISFANAASGIVDFALHAGRTYGGSLCNSTYNKVDAGTWSVTVYYGAAPSCTAPITLAATNITATSTDLGWTSAGALWDIELGTAGFTPTGIPTTAGTATNPYNATGLTANTSYDFYVRNDCGIIGTSSWTGPFTFKTLCDAATIPYLQDFSSWPPTCWDLTGGSNNWISYSGGIARANFWSINSGDLHMMSEPIIVNSNARFKFDWSRNTSTFYNDSVAVQIKEVGGSWNTVWGMTNPSSNDGAGNTFPGSFVTETIILDSATYTNKTIQIRFVGVSNWGPDFFVDNVIVEAIPNCPDALSLNSYNVTATSAMINWSNTAGSANSRIEYGPAGFTLGAGISMIVSNDTVPLIGLNSFTSYQYYVTSICTPSDSSPWAGPYSFTTLCNDTNVGPWMDDVEGHSSTSVITGIANCWSGTKTGTSFEWEITNSGTTGSSGTGANSANSGTNFFYTETSGAGVSDTTTLISPSIDLTSLTTPFLEFYYHMFGGQIGSLSVEVFNGTTWTSALTITGAQQASQASPWNQQFVDLSSYTGVIKLRFVALSNGSFRGDICLDDIAVIESPSCFSPTMAGATVMTKTTATLNWSAPLFGTPTSYIIKSDTAGFNPLTSGTTTVSSSLSLSLSGLTAKTNYEYYVRSYCGGTDSSGWVGPVSFYTWYCQPAPTSVDGSGITNVSIGTINNSTSSEPGNYGDYDSLSTDVIQGAPAQSFSVQYSTSYTYGTKIWIDWNDDLVFDATEQVYFGLSASTNPTTLVGTFAIPTSAPLGSHIMRIGGTDNNLGPTTPCYTGSYGSFEDYTLNVILPCYVNMTETIVTCDSLTWRNGNTYTVSNNTAIDTLKSNIAGICDTIWSLDLTVNYSSSTTDVHVACDSFTWIDGNTYTASNNSATYVLTNAIGCDSIITIDLTINYSISITNTLTVCNSYTRPGGTIANYSNTYYDTIQTVLGCDSMVTTVLTVNYTTYSTINPVACATYTSPSGKVWTSSALRRDTIMNSMGCDSLMTINLTIKPVTSETRTISSCFPYTVPETGSVYNTSGTYTDVSTNAFGCSHTITTVLTIITANAGTISVSGITMTSSATGVSYKWVDCDNNYSFLLKDTLQSFTPPRNGNYSCWITTPAGCSDTTAPCVSIESVSLEEYVVTSSDISIFPNPANDFVTIDILNQNDDEDVEIRLFDTKGKLVYSRKVSSKNNKVTFDVSKLAEGVYTVTVFNEFFSTSKKVVVVK